MLLDTEQFSGWAELLGEGKVPVALRLDTQPCLPHGSPILGLSPCPWHFCSWGTPSLGKGSITAGNPSFGRPMALLCFGGVGQADCAANKGQTPTPSYMECWALAGALTALPSSQLRAELAFAEEPSCPRTVPALPGWRGKQPWQQAQGWVWARRAHSC